MILILVSIRLNECLIVVDVVLDIVVGFGVLIVDDDGKDVVDCVFDVDDAVVDFDVDQYVDDIV